MAALKRIVEGLDEELNVLLKGLLADLLCNQGQLLPCCFQQIEVVLEVAQRGHFGICGQELGDDLGLAKDKFSEQVEASEWEKRVIFFLKKKKNHKLVSIFISAVKTRYFDPPVGHFPGLLRPLVSVVAAAAFALELGGQRSARVHLQKLNQKKKWLPN